MIRHVFIFLHSVTFLVRCEIFLLKLSHTKLCYLFIFLLQWRKNCHGESSFFWVEDSLSQMLLNSKKVFQTSKNFQALNENKID